MTFEYNRLLGRIKERFGSQKAFAPAIRLSERSLSLKICGRVDWKQAEIMRACDLLGIAPEEIHSYFFTLVVQN